MPIYEYECKACGHTFDTIQSFKEEPLTDCPVCKEPTLKKLISASAFHLKGSGWYVTDFKNPPAKKEQTEQPEKTKGESDNKTEANKENTKDSKEAAKESKKIDNTAAKPADKSSKTDKSSDKSS